MYHSTLPFEFVLPAEWERQSGIMLTWPHAETDWKPYLRQITDTYLELADIITRYEHLLVATPILESTRSMLAKRLSADQMNRVHLFEIDSNDTWARDHGPITLVCKSQNSGYMMPFTLLDFKFNGWGEKFRWEKDNAITQNLYYQGAFQNSAVNNHQGFVLEGGLALIEASKVLDENKAGLVGDEKVGFRIVKRALEEPIRQIADNAGLDGSVIADKAKNEKPGVGFNAARQEWVNMMDAGIIDPAKVTRCALQNAASVSGMLLTTECAITDIPEPPAPAPAGQPGMGDMGGMY